MTSPTEISVQKLSRLIGTPNCPIIIDVRTEEDFAANPILIPTAIRNDFNDIASLVPQVANRSVIIYCHKGLKISQGSAAILRAHGVSAETLKGGIISWIEARLPGVETSKIPARNQYGQSVWVTRQRPKIDRIACPWFIRRFIDPDAQFLFVSPSQVSLVAERFNATPFDIDGVFWGHRGKQCSFDTFVNEFGLQTDALLKFADIIRGADTNCHSLMPECAGLVAVSLGLSRMYKDDMEQLNSGMVIYDALYRWCRDASDEEHDDGFGAGACDE